MPKSWRMVEIEQQISHGISMEQVKQMLENWESVNLYAFAKHGGEDSPEPEKEEHIHLMLYFKNPVPTTAILQKCEAYGITIKENNLQKCRKWTSAVAYLTHENTDKPKYERSGIVANFALDGIIDKEVRAKQLREDTDRKLEIIENIDNGTIKPYNQHKFITATEFVTYSNVITRAYKYREDRLNAESGKGRSMEVIFISGPSGAGKDAYAHEIAEQRNMDVYTTSNSANPFDDYGGQPCIIWSDGRDNERKPQEVLRLLDNNFQSKEHARYRNITLECQLFIITSIKPLDQWYKDAFGENEESRKQLFRRIKTNIKMTFTTIEYQVYSEKQGKYNRIGQLPNTVIEKFKENDLSDPEKAMKFLAETLGQTAEIFQNMQTVVYEQMDETENPFN